MQNALTEVCSSLVFWKKKTLWRFVGTKHNSRNITNNMFFTLPVELWGTLAAFLPHLHLFSTCSAELKKKKKIQFTHGSTLFLAIPVKMAKICIDGLDLFLIKRKKKGNKSCIHRWKRLTTEYKYLKFSLFFCNLFYKKKKSSITH